ncbi:multi-sensor hybrid histidine kinase [Olavius sp. associated proteobacterium Delta 1]|nr:multi-sensor hybrid histidine kinase [Olavius sp. associated proteobacterium Delta 1]
MNKNANLDPENLLARIEYLEENRRLIQNALEMALSLGDFQKNINKGYGSEHILKEAEKRLRYLIPFEANAFYLVDQEESDFRLSVCQPSDKQQFIEGQVSYMIDEGFFAWAIRERRGVTISSHDHSKQLILHVIATYSRIRGMFVGLLPNKKNVIPDKSLTLLSIIMLNTANALESLEFYRLLRDQNTILEKKIEERTKALAQSERQLQQVMKLQAIGTLAGGIAHDFNNILFPIVGYTELTMDDIPEDSQARQNLEEILKATNRAKELVQQILTFSRQGGQERKPLQVQFLIKEALKLLRATIPSTIKIECNVDEECGHIMGDPTQIHQVAMNLCTNAYHAMQETDGTLEVTLKEVDISYEKSVERVGMKVGRHLELTVKDTGHGMGAEVLERIFEPYYTTKELGKGTGLGLSVIHGIIKNHGGDISVSSQLGSGTTFTVYLPVIDDIDVELKPVNAAAATQGNERILLIDDEEQVIDIEQQIIERLGYKVTPKTDSQEAFEEFAAQPEKFDLVITDMTMPKMTGDQLARKLMDIRPDIPVILCTGFNVTITEEKALAMGIDRFVMKPIVKDELAKTIRTVLDTPKVLPK